jgi:hypothetical protein
LAQSVPPDQSDPKVRREFKASKDRPDPQGQLVQPDRKERKVIRVRWGLRARRERKGRRAPRGLPALLVRPGQLDLRVPRVLMVQTRSKLRFCAGTPEVRTDKPSPSAQHRMA